MKLLKNMKFKKPILISIFVFFLCATSCYVTDQLIYRGCLFWGCAPRRSFDAMDLGLPKTLFPDDADYYTILSDRNAPIRTESNGIQTIYWGSQGGLGIYIVYQYATTKDAQEDYEWTRDWFFEDSNTNIPWEENESTNISTLADEFYSACGYREGKRYRCGMVARYQEFYVFFNSTITDEMSFEDFQEAINFIDQQMHMHFDGE
jgi:hypothetical protein